MVVLPKVQINYQGVFLTAGEGSVFHPLSKERNDVVVVGRGEEDSKKKTNGQRTRFAALYIRVV